MLVRPPSLLMIVLVKKIKSQLIEKAQIKKEYSKVQREREEAEKAERPLPVAEHTDENHAPSTALHPDRQTLMDKESESPEPQPTLPPQRNRTRKPKAIPFKREYEQAQQRKAKAEEERNAREEAARQRLQKREERERFQKAMAKARRGGKNGQRKLGRESLPLLEKVKRMVGESG